MKEMNDLFGRLDRRSFLKLSGVLGLGVATAGFASAATKAVSFNKKLMMVSETRLDMGTFVSMTLLHPSKDQAEEAMGRAFEETTRLSGLMTRFDQASPVSFVNKEGHIRDLPPEVVQIVSDALYYFKFTGGAFDITVKPIVDFFQEKLGGDKKVWPTESEIKDLLKLVDARKVELQGNSLHFKDSGMGITLDGIAKGFIVDRAAELLNAQGIENYLINAGGEVCVRGSKEGDRPWTVAIQDPWKRKNYPDVVHLKDATIATSGNYEVYFDKEKIFYHIVDPKTGFSPHLSTSVSIMAKTGTEADALSTGVFVMGPEVGTRFVNAHPAYQSLIIARDGTLSKSKGWKSAAI
jgi:thiamine biosynthesis lipoprotein